MKTKLSILFFLFSFSVFAVPNIITYQGQLYTNNFPLTATQEFSFAMITNGATAWQSGSTVTSTVENGMFSVNLGDTNIMNPLPAAIFDSTEDVYLRVSVGNVGGALTVLSPDKKITSAGYVFDSGRLAGLLPAAYMRTFENVIIVGRGGREGGADTNTLAAGIAVAGALANPVTPYTVLLLPGTYAGYVTTISSVNIVGLARDACIITGKFTVTDDVMLQNLTFRNSDNEEGLIVQTNSLYLDNVKIHGGLYGLDVEKDATDVTVHNVDISGRTNSAVRDACGIIIDGMRVDSRAAFTINTTNEINYNNILCKNEPGLSGKINVSANGTIRAFVASKKLEINRCGNLEIKNIDIDCSVQSEALSIATVDNKLEISDGLLKGYNTDAVIISNATDDINKKIIFNDVRMETDGDNSVIRILTAPYVIVKDCELSTDLTGFGSDIFCETGQFVYVQTSWLRGGVNCITLKAPDTQLFVYDSTLLNGTTFPTAAAIQGYISGATTGAPPRIADCRFETDTNPSQNTGAPGWNAFGANGAVGFQEDSNGNIVAPASGTPVSP